MMKFTHIKKHILKFHCELSRTGDFLRWIVIHVYIDNVKHKDICINAMAFLAVTNLLSRNISRYHVASRGIITERHYSESQKIQ